MANGTIIERVFDIRLKYKFQYICEFIIKTNDFRGTRAWEQITM